MKTTRRKKLLEDPSMELFVSDILISAFTKRLPPPRLLIEAF